MTSYWWKRRSDGKTRKTTQAATGWLYGELAWNEAMDLSEDRLRDNDVVNNDGDDDMWLSTVAIRVDIDGQKFCGQLAGRCFFVSMLEIPLKLRFVHFVHISFHKKARIWLVWLSAAHWNHISVPKLFYLRCQSLGLYTFSIIQRDIGWCWYFLVYSRQPLVLYSCFISSYVVR